MQQQQAEDDTDYAYWDAALIAVENGTPLPPIQDGKPLKGFYRTRVMKGGPWLPVAIYRDAGRMVVLVNEIESQDPNKTWLGCARHPIAYKTYEHRIEFGVWPDEASAEPREAAIGDNAPPADPVDVVLARELDAVSAWIKITPINSDEAAEEAGRKVEELRKLKTRVEELHATEKKPHWDKCKEIDDKYMPLIRDTPTNPGRAVVAIKFVLTKINDWFDFTKAEAKRIADEAARETERQRLIEEATQRATAVAQEAVAGQRGTEGLDPPPMPIVPPPPPVPPPKLAVGGTIGSKITQRTKPVAMFDGEEGQDKCYAHFKGHPDVAELLLKLAQKQVNMKMTVPGIKVKDTTVAQ